MVKEKQEVNHAAMTDVTAPLMPLMVVTIIACAAIPERPEMLPRLPRLKPYHVNHMMQAPSAIIARPAGRLAVTMTPSREFARVAKGSPAARLTVRCVRTLPSVLRGDSDTATSWLPSRGPSTNALVSAQVPPRMCTTAPPAMSITPECITAFPAAGRVKRINFAASAPGRLISQVQLTVEAQGGTLLCMRKQRMRACPGARTVAALRPESQPCCCGTQLAAPWCDSWRCCPSSGHLRRAHLRGC
jgi:hypothetical protein